MAVSSRCVSTLGALPFPPSTRQARCENLRRRHPGFRWLVFCVLYPSKGERFAINAALAHTSVASVLFREIHTSEIQLALLERVEVREGLVDEVSREPHLDGKLYLPSLMGSWRDPEIFAACRPVASAVENSCCRKAALAASPNPIPFANLPTHPPSVYIDPLYCVLPSNVFLAMSPSLPDSLHFRSFANHPMRLFSLWHKKGISRPSKIQGSAPASNPHTGRPHWYTSTTPLLSADTVIV